MAMSIVSKFVRPALGRVCVRGFAAAPARPSVSKMTEQLTSHLKEEYQHEKESYEQPSSIKEFLSASSPWKLTDVAGDSSLKLTRSFEDKVLTVEWQSTSPVPEEQYEEEEAEGEENQMSGDSTNFTVTLSDKTQERGVILYCCTATGDHRYVIGNVRSFASAAERDSNTAYAGPDFEDLDDNIQEAMDALNAEMGINDELCDFIDQAAVDKEQREYVRWLKNVQDLFAH